MSFNNGLGELGLGEMARHQTIHSYNRDNTKTSTTVQENYIVSPKNGPTLKPNSSKL